MIQYPLKFCLVGILLILLIVGCISQNTTSDNVTKSTSEAFQIAGSIASTPTTKTMPNHPTKTTFPTITTTPTVSTSNVALSTVTTATPERSNAESQNIYVPLEFISLEELVGGQYLMEIKWQPGGRYLTYALWSDEKSREPRGWEWWRYDIEGQQKQPLPPPESLVSEETRRQLNLCPIDEAQWDSDTACWRLSSLFESPYSDHIIFQPIPEENGEFGDGELWIARRDGSNVQKLAEFTPSYVRWSSDGQWLLTSQHFPGLPGQETHYLAKTDGSFIERLNQLSGTDHFLINGLFPEFSPDSSRVAFLGSTISESFNEDDYHLYVLNLETLDSQLVSDRVGLFQWDDDSQGIYVFDKGHYPIDPTKPVGIQQGNLYFIDLNGLSEEILLATNLPYYPLNSFGTWLWTFSIQNKAIAYIGFQENEELGIIQLAVQSPE